MDWANWRRRNSSTRRSRLVASARASPLSQLFNPSRRPLYSTTSTNPIRVMATTSSSRVKPVCRRGDPHLRPPRHQRLPGHLTGASRTVSSVTERFCTRPRQNTSTLIRQARIPVFSGFRHALGVGAHRTAPGESAVDRTLVGAFAERRFAAVGSQNRLGIQRRLGVVIRRTGITQASGEDLQQYAERDAEEAKCHQHFQQGKAALAPSSPDPSPGSDGFRTTAALRATRP